MYLRLYARFIASGLLLLVIASLLSGLAAANTVPISKIVNSSRPITLNDLKPAECAALNLTTLVTGSGKFSGTAGNDLILGSPAADDIRGNAGTDCVLGGGGDDKLDGREHNDVLLGGPDSDNILGGSGTDYCYSAVSFSGCEFMYP